MLDFVFFNAQTRDRFITFLRQHAVAFETSADDESYGVSIPDETGDALLETVESYYEQMMELDQALFEAGEGDAGQHVAGVVLDLASGDSVYARVPPGLLAKVMEVLTAEELGELVSAIVAAVELRDRSPLCGGHDAAAIDGQ
ncbi:MAG: hypothetical protein KDI88_17970 [Gammaproteobacteria bacterium]|nr:hypothetical protein [Gammaproteobacteria bacterium]